MDGPSTFDDCFISLLEYKTEESLKWNYSILLLAEQFSAFSGKCATSKQYKKFLDGRDHQGHG